MKTPWLRSGFLALALLSASAVAADGGRRMKVEFFNALVDPDGNPVSLFGASYVTAAQAAARQLNIDLKVFSAFRPDEMLAEARKLTSGPDRPDYLLISIHRGMQAQLLQLAETARIPVFVVNAGLLPEDRARYAGPRDHFKYWLGEMLPDEEQAGYDLAKILIARARAAGRFDPHGRVLVAGLGGREVDYAAVMRNQGLNRAVAEDPQASLLQIVPALWYRDRAKDRTALLVQRYPGVDAIWAANDAMAIGATEALAASGRKPGREVFLGGMNWDEEGLQAVRDGRLVASLGGHFIEPAWALVLLYDYEHGRDFASERIEWRSPMRMLTQGNVDRYANRLTAVDWDRLDFKRFSKVFNPDLKTYHFSLEDLLGLAPAPETGQPLSP